MSLPPEHVAIRRAKGDVPLPALVLGRPDEDSESPRIEYRLHRVVGQESTTPAGPIPSTAPTTITPRHFHLQRKRGAQAAGFATFAEAGKRARVNDVESNKPNTLVASTQLKRPSRRSGLSSQHDTPSESPRVPSVQTDPNVELVDALHAFAQEEEARDAAAQLQAQPKRPIMRLRDRQKSTPQRSFPKVEIDDTSVRVVGDDGDVEMTDDGDYTFDIYVRTQKKSNSEDKEADQPLGYLIIQEEDQPLWGQYLEEDNDEEEANSDEEDENAEGYYGADYPEDEVASDDEFGKGAYGYRHGGSDEEQWDSDTGAFSDDDDQAMRNPWKNSSYMQKKVDKSLDADDSD